MLSGNGFSVQLNMDEAAIEAELTAAMDEGRKARFQGTDEAKTIVAVQAERIEGYMLMPLAPTSELSIPRGMRSPVQ